MNYTVRDKTGKHLGSFDLPSLQEMVKNSRLQGDEEVLGQDQSWKPLSSVPELAQLLPGTGMQAGGDPGGSAPPEDLMNIFQDVDESPQAGQEAAPDFTLPGAPPTDAPNPAPSAAPDVPDLPGTPSQENSSTLDELWTDDNGNAISDPVLGDSHDLKTVVGTPPPSSEATQMGTSPLVDGPDNQPLEMAATPQEPPAAANDATQVGAPPTPTDSGGLDASDLFDVSQSGQDAQPAPTSPASPPADESDPLSGLLQDASAPPEPEAPAQDDFLQYPDGNQGGSTDTPPGSDSVSGLEDLFSSPSQSGSPPLSDAAPPASSENNAPAAPAGEKQDGLDELFFPDSPPPPEASAEPAAPTSTPASSGPSEGLDEILNSTPDAFAADLSMPDAPPAETPKSPPPPAAPPKAPAPRGSPPQLPTQRSAEQKKRGVSETLSEKFGDIKEQIAEKSKALIIVNILILVCLILGGLYYVLAHTKSGLFGKKLVGTKLIDASSVKKTTGNTQTPQFSAAELYEKAKQKMGRDNYGTYIEIAKLMKKAEQLPDGQKALYSIVHLKALTFSQLRNKPEKAILMQMDEVEARLSSNENLSSEALTSLGAYHLVKGNSEKARDVLNQAIQLKSDNSAAIGLIGNTYLADSDLVNSESYFNQSITINPANLTSLYGLVQIANLQNNPTLAEQRIKKILELSPNHIASRIDMAIIHFNRGEFGEAEKNLILITGSQSKDASGNELAKAHYYLGLILEKQKKPEEAGKQYQKAVDADASDPKMLYALGNYLLGQDKIEDAKNRFMAAIQLHKKDDYIVGYASALIKEKKFGDAMLWLQQAIRLNSKHAIAHLQMGYVQKQLGNTTKAISHFRESQKFGKNNLEPTIALADIFASLNKMNLAITEYRKAIAIAPKDPIIHLRLGDILFQKRIYTASAKEYKLAAEYTTDGKDRAEIYNKLGKALSKNNQFKDAIEAQKKAVRLIPNFIEALLDLGEAHFLAGSFSESKDTLLEIRDLSPQGDQLVQLRFHLANAYRQTGEYEEAIKNYNQVLEAKPDFVIVYYHLGVLYMQQNVYPKAISQFEIALPKLKGRREHLQALVALGKSYMSMENVFSAEKTYLKAVKMYPRNEDGYFLLGQLYQDQRKTDLAIRYFLKSVKLNPKNAMAHYLLAYSYKELDFPEQALKHFKIALRLNPKTENSDQIREEIGHLQRLR